ncbi:reprolysin-like metallopeptidase [Candidatus Blastococcus massiliensis]|uniref:reprolysin-like metallopeptidase n=1 Tax=Candidatus Blastococcus massiliensis TaxID=1470358 RepID=UPI0012DE4C7B|nr:M66 family metalloprotease [Candidatus Blastococcus massiliensis]
MSPARGLRRPAALLRVLVVAGAVAAAVTAGPVVAVASADEPAGTTVVGRLVQAVPETEHHDHHGHGHDADPLTWVETAQGAVPVQSADVEDLPVGSTVTLDVDGEVTGEEDGEPLPVLSTGAVVPPAPAAVLPGPVTNEVTVVLVAPAGTAPDAGATAGQVAALVSGPVAEFWSSQTGGAVRVGVGPTHEWITTTTGCADARALWNEVAAEVGFQPGPGKHLLLRLSSQTRNQPGCYYALAEVGSGPGSGGLLYVRDQLTSVIAHELGHNFGLNHSSALQCDGALETGTCRTAGYRDYYDVMGASWKHLGSLSAPQAALLGALPASGTRHLGVHDAPESLLLAPLATGSGTRAIRLTDAEGTDYWLEYRSATRQDSWLGSPAENRYGLDSGVLLRRSATFPDTAVLLDGTPAAAAGWDADLQTALPAGEPIVLSGGDFTVTVRSLADGASIDVVPTAAGQAVVPAAPRDNGAGQLQAGTARSGQGAGTSPSPATGPAVAEVDPLTVPWFPTEDRSAVLASPMLEPTSGTASLGGLAVALAGAGLAGTTLLVVRRARRLRLR